MPRTYVCIASGRFTAQWSISCSLTVGVDRCCLEVGSRRLAASWFDTLLVVGVFNESQTENGSKSTYTQRATLTLLLEGQSRKPAAVVLIFAT